MRVRKIAVKAFMSHEQTALEFPAVGLVVVTGPNGAGKSSIVEAVATAAWGKTLRGTSPWQTSPKGGRCVAKLDLGEVVIERDRTRSKGNVRWNIVEDGTEAGAVLGSLARLGAVPGGGTDNPRFESASQAQAALERVIGSFDVWRRSCAFSSSDAAHFSLATDGERKRMLEAILGLDVFDAALAICRDHVAVIKNCFDSLRETTQRRHDGFIAAGQALEAAQENFVEATRALEALDRTHAVAPSPAEVRRVSGLVDEMNGQIGLLQKKLRDGAYRAAEAAANVRNHERSQARLAQKQCPTCGQDIAVAQVASSQGELDAARAAVARIVDENAATSAGIELELAELEADRAVMRDRMADLKSAATRAKESAEIVARAERAAERQAAAVASARASLDGAVSALGEAKAASMRAEREYAVALAAEAVLGLRGVRAHVLGRSLAGLAAVANAWLPRLGIAGLEVELKPYSEKKAGGVTDSISVEIVGAGGGHGYRATSAGERRRVDLALLLGISDIAAAASGRAGSTLFFDELFDALDDQGIAAVSAALVELAADRCIVVITHNPALAAALPAAARWHVEDGKVTT